MCEKVALLFPSFSVCSERCSAADSLGCRDGGWRGGCRGGGQRSGHGGRPESIGSVMRWLCAR